MATTRGRLATAAVCAGLAAIVAAAFWQRWRVLGATPFPVGVDGYFYPVQVRSLLETGGLRYPSSPVTFYWMLPFAAATDPITGAKLAAALGTSLIAVPAYGVGTRLGGSRGAGFVAAVIAALSASSGYLALEFVKQGVGLTVALAALWAILRALEWAPDPRVPSARIGGAHVFAFRRVTVAVLAIVIAGIVAPHRCVSMHDLRLVAHLFDSTSRYDAPALVPYGGAKLVFAHEALLAGLVSLAAAIVLLVDARRGQPRLSRELRFVGLMISALGLVIAIPYLRVDDPQGLGFRLRLAAIVPLALGAAICAGALAHRFARHALPILAGLALAIAAIELPQDRAEGQVLTHPDLAAAVGAAYGRIPAIATVIVPERHILFMGDWYTRAPVSLRPEAIPRRYRVRLFGLVFAGGKFAPLYSAIYTARRAPNVEPPLGLHPDDPNGLVLVSEPTWSWLLGHLPDDQRAHYAAWPTI